MKKALIITLAVVLTLAGLSGAVVGYSFWRFAAHVPEADYPEPKDVTEARLQDVDYLRLLPQVDKSFSDEEVAALNAHIDSLEARVATLSDERFIMEIAAAAAITENGHTGVSTRFLLDAMNSLPVRFFLFGDGLFIVRTRAEREDLIGMKVASYAGVSPDDLFAGLEPYHGGNLADLRFNSARFFAAPSALHAIGLIPDPDSVALELVDADGGQVTVTLEAEKKRTEILPLWRSVQSLEHESEVKSGNAWRFLPEASTQATWYGRNPDQVLWTDTLPQGGVYWRMRDVFGDEDVTAQDWLEAEAAKLREDPADFLVLDLRTNLGGNYIQAVGVMNELPELVTDDGRIYVLTDGATFSAGIVSAAIALAAGGEKAVMVGENMGDFGQFWAEGGGPMVLPNSKAPIYVSTGYHDWENGCESFARCFWPNVFYGVAAGPLEVDIHAPLTFSDYIKGVDTGIEAILAAEAER